MRKRAPFYAIIIFVPLSYLLRAYINWKALAAVGTISAVFWAVYHQGILAWIDRPILKVVEPYEPEPPHLRKVPLRFKERRIIDGRIAEIEVARVTSYQLSIQIKNTGKTTARNTAVLVSNMGRFKDGKWDIQPNWIPAPVRWALDVPADVGGEIPTEEKNLIPERPYAINLGALRMDYPNSFVLNVIIMPGNQDRAYEPGVFCFECTAFAEGADSTTKYVCIEWKGGCSEDLEKVKERIKVSLEDRAPWKKR
jgi:hypothetical protein